ncbi:MAG: flavin reductase family protein [Desulfosarcinaceae bacterium]|nr:flavin reductase family protein [Desulfosarcinaceae bacterium]
MAKVSLDPSPLLYPTPAVLVAALVDERPNCMTAAWCGIASSSPPAITVGIRPERHTYRGIRQQGTFSINVPSVNLARKVDFAGIYSGRKEDKSELFEYSYGKTDSAPIVTACGLNLICRLKHTLSLGSHDLIVGEVVEILAEESCLTNGAVDAAKLDPLVYSAGAGVYQGLGEIVGRAFSIGKKKHMV